MVDRGRISSQDWEQVFQDFRGTPEARSRWLTQYTPLGLLEQALQAVGSRKEFALKLQTLAFLDENAALLAVDDAALDLLLDTLRSTLQAPSSSDGNSAGNSALASSSIKEQMMVTVTSTMVSIDSLARSPRSLEILVEVLLVFVNRPNHSTERHLRAIACECLRELEKAYPCLLHSCAGHLLALCQSERTHACQSYMLLLTCVLRNIALYMPQLRAFYAGTFSILFTTVPLVPFSVPAFLSSASPVVSSSSSRDFSEECIKEFRRVISFLLEKPSLFTECGVAEFISHLCQTASCLDLHPSLLKIQFWNLLHAYSPISCHAFLTILARFPDAFEGEEVTLYKRLVLFSRELAQPLTVRLLALHWLLGLENLITSRGREPVLPLVAKSIYPEAFDPLSLKAAKLECLARCALVFDRQQEEGSSENFVRVMVQEEAADMASRLLNDGLVCLSSYKWLPSNSTETRLLFHTLHRFLVSGLEHSPKVVVLEDGESLSGSLLFRSLQDNLVRMARNLRKLVDKILALLDRFLDCDAHRSLGERLLRTFSEDLVPSLPSNSHLPAYFPLMERIAESSKIPPAALIKSLEAYLRYKVAKHSGSNAANYWLRGSEVLTICRTLLMHHPSSRVFGRLTELFGYLCLYFPDIEVRDNARFYLRMLISIPGNKLRDILAYGEERTEDTKPQLLHVSSFLGSPSPRAYQGKKQSLQISSFIHLTRETPLLVRSSWSLVLHDAFQPILETVPAAESKVSAGNGDAAAATATEDDALSDHPGTSSEEVLRMMDAKTAGTLVTLRRHFSQVSESGVKIEVVCRLRVKSLDATENSIDPQDRSGGIYAAVISFSTSGLYGPIPPVRVPYLPSEPSHKTKPSPVSSPTCDGSERRVKFLDVDSPKSQKFLDSPRSQLKDQQVEGQRHSKVVKIVLEPKQPVPTLVDCHIVFTDEEAQTVHGQLESIPVGIEDLFMKPRVPSDASDEAEYLLSLFEALWYGCGGPGKLGSEIFLLKDGGKGLGLQGSESVKLLEAQADRVVAAVENYLAEYVVSVSGSALKEMARYSGKFERSCWVEDASSSSRGSSRGSSSATLDRLGDDEGRQSKELDHLDVELSSLESDSRLAADQQGQGGQLGCFLVLVFLPPRYHLLLRMEVSDWSTLIRIRTDYWPSLAHVDEFLEAFVLPRTSSL